MPKPKDGWPAEDIWTIEWLLRLAVLAILIALVMLIMTACFVRMRASTQLADLKRKLKKKSPTTEPKVVGFFHPSCDAGAGGEKVLWQAVNTLLTRKFDGCELHVMIYSSSKMATERILKEKVEDRFGLKLGNTANLHFVDLAPECVGILNQFSQLYWQAIGYMRVCVHALNLMPCDIFIDTTGAAFAYPVISCLFPCKIYSYTHYPTVSNDMLKTVQSGEIQYNNKAAAGSMRQQIKAYYYQVLIILYRICGQFTSQVAANSSWTRGHVNDLWNLPEDKAMTLYPPCGEEFGVIELDSKRDNVVVSFAQFRPEKEHLKQLEIWKKVLADGSVPSDSMLVMIGTCREGVASDEKIVRDIEERAKELGLSNKIRIEKNQPRSRVLEVFSRAKAAIHTMRHEHFGIAIVELMNSGIITVAHKSAGPEQDIIGASPQPVGYLADTADEYAYFLRNALREFDSANMQKLRKDARQWVKRFGTEAFCDGFSAQMKKML